MAEFSKKAWIVPSFVFFLLCASIAIFCFFSSVHKPFTLDETDLVIRADAIRMLGPKGPEAVFGEKHGEAIPHLPMYDYTLSLIFLFFGTTEVAARCFGILCFLLVGIVMARTLILLLDKETLFLKNTAIFFALCLYLVNPLILQHSLLIDADSTYTFLYANLFVYFFIHYEKTRSRFLFQRPLVLALVFTLLLWSKEGTPFLIAAGVLIYRLLNREWKKMAGDLFFVFVLGSAMAWGVWLVYCQSTNIDSMIFLRQQEMHRFGRIGQGINLKLMISEIPLNLRWPFLWVSPVFFILLSGCLLQRFLVFFKRRKLELIDFCFLSAATVWVPYFFIRPSMDMMKYQHPVYPLFIVGIVGCLAGFFKPAETAFRRCLQEKSGLLVFFIILWASLCSYYYKLGDSILFLAYSVNDARSLRHYQLYFLPVVLAFAGVLIFSLYRRRISVIGFVLVCFLFIFSTNSALDLRQTGSYTTAESWLNYGESGLKETAAYLSTRLSPQARTVLRKDLLYYLKSAHGVVMLNNRDPMYIFRGREFTWTVLDFMGGNSPEVVVLDSVSMAISAAQFKNFGDKIFSRYRVEKKMGNFIVLRRIGNVKIEPQVS